MKVLLICNYRAGVGGISGQVEALLKHLRQEGHEVDIFSTKGSVLRRISLLFGLLREAKGYDVLHVHCCSGWGFLPAVMCLFAARIQGKRLVLTYHGGGAEVFFANHKCLVHKVLTRTDCNIVLNGFTEGVFRRHSLPCMVIPNILDIEPGRFRPRETIAPRYVCTRAHEDNYNIPCILHAFGAVQSKMPEATLTLVGDGSQHDALLRMVSDMRLRNVTFAGRVANSDIFHLLDGADVLLSAPRVDNMPVSLLEAMAAGLLVISSNVGGVPFVISDGYDGLLFESGSSDELAQKMLWAVDNQVAARTIIQNAHRSVEQYRWDNIKDKLYKAYGVHP